MEIARFAVLLIAMVLWVMYVAEAWRQSTGQALLTLVVPFYVLYFAHVRSSGSWITRTALTGFTVLFLLL
jgi:hypothetical protein